MTTPEPKSQRAAVADPAKLNELLTRLFKPFYGEKPREVRVHPAAFSFEPQGSRLLVVCYPSPEEYGGLALPQSAEEQAGLGVIMAAGHEAFNGRAVHPGSGFFVSAEEALYHTVAFGKYSGKPLVLNYTRDSNFNSTVLVLSDRDIWCVRYPEGNAPYKVKNDYLEVTE